LDGIKSRQVYRKAQQLEHQARVFPHSASAPSIDRACYDRGVKGRVRLDRALSKLGLASRSDARRLILSRKVAIAGRLITDPAHLIVPERAAITIDGRSARRAAWRTIALHKPRGVVTTRRDPDARKTVFDLLGDEAESLVPVGRLDLASTGLLLLTTDTSLAAWLTNPQHAIIRRYVVTVRGAVSDAAIERMIAGLEGLRAHAVNVLKRSKRETHLRIELTEGRNREIRRLLTGVGHEVTRLLRVAFGPIELGALPPGAWRDVSRQEIAAAFRSKERKDRTDR
jgi:23S rRNA pseudouridine2605 synthase